MPGPRVDVGQVDDLAGQPALLGELSQRGVARMLTEVDPAAGQRPHPVGRVRRACCDAAQQDRVAIGAQRVGRDAGHAPRLVGHSAAYVSAPRRWMLT
jgi:hypothetical protein